VDFGDIVDITAILAIFRICGKLFSDVNCCLMQGYIPQCMLILEVFYSAEWSMK